MSPWLSLLCAGMMGTVVRTLMGVRGVCNHRALHNTHAPFEVPEQYSGLYNYSLPLKNTWAGMVSMVDETLANVTRALRSTKMWSNTLLVMAGDNGSPVCGWGAAGSNHPLRGSKASNWYVHLTSFDAVSKTMPVCINV